jgi:hypothetical protein
MHVKSPKEIEKTKKEGEHPAAKVQPVEPTEKTMLLKGSERSEDEKKYWYDAFGGLVENPFRYFEATFEEDAPTVGGYIETNMDRRIHALLDAKESAIVKGPRGCGKSSLVLFGAWSKDKHFIRVATPKNVADVYDEIFFGFKPSIRMESAQELWGDDLERLIDYEHRRGTFGQRSVCTLCRRRCSLPTPTRPSLKPISEIGHIPPPCLARKAIAQRAVELSPPDGCLLDIPDEADQKDIIDLTPICVSMIQCSALIIFATEEQSKILARSDTFSRLRVIEFEKMSENFLIKLFKGRIDASREGSGPYPFEDGVIKKIAALADNNPREFIHICSRVLIEMWLRKMTSPCTPAFLNELNIRPAAPNDRATIVRILKRHEGQWVGIQNLAREISGALGAPFSERKTGAAVRELGFGQFKHDTKGRSQVLISPNVLNAIGPHEDTEHSEG